MATKEEMYDVIYDMIENDRKLVLGLVLDPPSHVECSPVEDVFVRALHDAEVRGRCYNGRFGAHDEPCIYWMVGNYLVTYPTDDLEFHAEVLTDAMLDDLIIEVVE